MKLLLVLVSFSLAAVPASAEMYRWVDEHGKVQYSDQPPPEKAKTGKKLDIPNQPASPAADATKTAKDKELDFRKRQTDAATADAKQKKADEEKQASAANCDAARKNLRTLEESGRVFTYNEQGERAYMSDAEREKSMATARKAVADWCK
jgi:hypothetical protein